MSGCNYEGECPKCHKQMNSYSDYKPYDIVNHECLNCGFVAYTREEQITLEEVNELRAEIDLKPLKKLAKQVD